MEDYTLEIVSQISEEEKLKLILNLRFTMLFWRMFSKNSEIPLNLLGEEIEKAEKEQDVILITDILAHMLNAGVQCYNKKYNEDQEIDFESAIELVGLMPVESSQDLLTAVFSTQTFKNLTNSGIKRTSEGK